MRPSTIMRKRSTLSETTCDSLAILTYLLFMVCSIVTGQYQGMCTAGVGHRLFGVDLVQLEEAEYLDGPSQLGARHVLSPAVYQPLAGADRPPLPVQHRRLLQCVEDACVKALVEEGEQALYLAFGVLAQV